MITTKWWRRHGWAVITTIFIALIGAGITAHLTFVPGFSAFSISFLSYFAPTMVFSGASLAITMGALAFFYLIALSLLITLVSMVRNSVKAKVLAKMQEANLQKRELNWWEKNQWELSLYAGLGIAFFLISLICVYVRPTAVLGAIIQLIPGFAVGVKTTLVAGTLVTTAPVVTLIATAMLIAAIALAVVLCLSGTAIIRNYCQEWNDKLWPPQKDEKIMKAPFSIRPYKKTSFSSGQSTPEVWSANSSQSQEYSREESTASSSNSRDASSKNPQFFSSEKKIHPSTSMSSTTLEETTNDKSASLADFFQGTT